MSQVLWIILGVNAGLVVANGVGLWLLGRLIHRWAVLDHLLSQMAVQSIADHHIPLWKAWSGVMGSLDIDITVNRQSPEAD